MGASSVFFEVWLPSLRHKRPCETCVPMNVRGKSLHGSTRTFKKHLTLFIIWHLEDSHGSRAHADVQRELHAS